MNELADLAAAAHAPARHARTATRPNVGGPRWAAIKTTTADEYTESGQVVHRTRHEIRMRYTPAITSDCRIIYGSKIYNPTAVENVDEANVELLITASGTGG